MDATTPERPVRSSQRLANKQQARTQKRPSPSKPATDQASSDSTDAGKRLRQSASASEGSLPSTDTAYDAQTSVEHKQDTNNRSSNQTAVSDSEVTSPEGPYIQGTHLRLNGWFQACRGCHEVTAKSLPIWDRQVPICGRCQVKYSAMVDGHYPPGITAADPALDPLSYWIPAQPAQLRMAGDARRAHVDILLLQQDNLLQARGHPPQ